MKSVIFHYPLPHVRRLYHILGLPFIWVGSCQQWRITDFADHADRMVHFRALTQIFFHEWQIGFPLSAKHFALVLFSSLIKEQRNRFRKWHKYMLLGQAMDIEANTPANTAMSQGVPTGRRGRPKGLPKPEGSGRRAGVPNRITRDIRATAAKHSTKAIATLVKLLGNNDPKIRAIAARELLDRAHGKPLSPQEITGKDGTPLNPAPETSDTRRAQLLAFIFAKQLDKSGYQMDRSGRIFPRYAPASREPASDRSAEIEAAQAAVLPQAAAPDPAPEEVEAARREREDQRYLLSRSEEQGFGEVNRPNVIRMRPHGK